MNLNKLITRLDKLEGNTPINDPGYKFYSFNPTINKICGGWEYQEDCKDDVKEWKSNGVNLICYTKSFLKSKNINPDDNKNWGNYK